jgi:4a-hydroxytetrahydrobiopterin dehydratase
MTAPRPAKLSPSEITAALSALPKWSVVDDKLHRELRFADFVAAFGFMTGAALVAQAMDHHPEWFNVWNTVRIDLSTHDAGGITVLDFRLAQAMEDLAARQPLFVK